MADVLIRGGGVSAICCAYLLTRAGFRVRRDAAAIRAPLPAILLSESAQQLIGDLFGKPNLFDGLPRIRTRIVAWGSEAIALPHAAVVVSEMELLRSLATPVIEADDSVAARWTIHTSPASSPRSFGSREASAFAVKLRADAEPDACWIESVHDGWLFLITTEPGSAWLLGVGGEISGLLASSRFVQGKVARMNDSAGRFAAGPRIAQPLCGDGWLACGSAAMAFDPLCGDGAAHSIREAILAAAVIEADASGEDRESLLRHYQARLTAAFQRHLMTCLQYYRSGGTGAWWNAQAEALGPGLAWCESELNSFAGFRYRLDGLHLRPLLPV